MDDRQNKCGTSKPVTGKISTAYKISYLFTQTIYFKNSLSPPAPSYIRDFLPEGPLLLADYGNIFFGIFRDTIGRRGSGFIQLSDD